MDHISQHKNSHILNVQMAGIQINLLNSILIIIIGWRVNVGNCCESPGFCKTAIQYFGKIYRGRFEELIKQVPDNLFCSVTTQGPFADLHATEYFWRAGFGQYYSRVLNCGPDDFIAFWQSMDLDRNGHIDCHDVNIAVNSGDRSTLHALFSAVYYLSDRNKDGCFNQHTWWGWNLDFWNLYQTLIGIQLNLQRINICHIPIINLLYC